MLYEIQKLEIKTIFSLYIFLLTIKMCGWLDIGCISYCGVILSA